MDKKENNKYETPQNRLFGNGWDSSITKRRQKKILKTSKSRM